MTKEKKSIVQTLSAIITALKRIIIIIKESYSEEEDTPPLHKKTGYIYKTISALKTSQLNDFLNLTDNELKILDYIIRYRAITARNLRAFLRVSRRQIYNYLERLHTFGFITYTTVPIGDGPPTRFYHFSNLSQLTKDQFTAIVVAERSAKQRHKVSMELGPKKLLHLKCPECFEEFQDYEKPAQCPSCGYEKLVIRVDSY